MCSPASKRARSISRPRTSTTSSPMITTHRRSSAFRHGPTASSGDAGSMEGATRKVEKTGTNFSKELRREIHDFMLDSSFSAIFTIILITHTVYTDNLECHNHFALYLGQMWVDFNSQYIILKLSPCPIKSTFSQGSPPKLSSENL